MLNLARSLRRAIPLAGYGFAMASLLGGATQAFANDEDRPDARTSTRMTEKSAAEEGADIADEREKQSSTAAAERGKSKAKETKAEDHGGQAGVAADDRDGETGEPSEEEMRAVAEEGPEDGLMEPQEAASEAQDEDAILPQAAQVHQVDASEARLLGAEEDSSLTEISVP